MKIAHVTQKIGQAAGGLNFSVQGLAKAALAEGDSVRIFTIGRYAKEVTEQWLPVDLRVFKALWPKFYGVTPDMSEAVIEFFPDVIHCHGIWAYHTRAAWIGSKRLRKPIVLSPRGMLHPEALRVSTWKKRLLGAVFEWKFLDRCNCFHALNYKEAAYIRELGYRQPICVVPNGVNLPKLQNRSSTGKLKRLLFLGRLHPIKNIPELIRAWGMLIQEVGKENVPWLLTIAGWEDGNYEAKWQDLAQNCGCADRIEWVGPLFGQAKEEMLQSADAFVLPSLSEGHPMSVVEAWSYALPVLMTPECNLADGYAASAAIEISKDAAGIFEGLSKLVGMSDSELREIGKNGRRLVENRYTWEIQVRQLDSVYKWLLGEGEKPDCIEIYE